jgi:hypothetical protein
MVLNYTSYTTPIFDWKVVINMKPESVSQIFEVQAQWPQLPPWWLLPGPQAAALLNIKPATLQQWRVRGYGPTPVPPMYLRPTQGDPLYFRYGDVRAWAASKVGLTFTLEDQCLTFFKEAVPGLEQTPGTVQTLAKVADWIFQFDRNRLQSGMGPLFLSDVQVGSWDAYYSRQPKFRNPEVQPPLCGPRGGFELPKYEVVGDENEGSSHGRS